MMKEVKFEDSKEIRVKQFVFRSNLINPTLNIENYIIEKYDINSSSYKDFGSSFYTKQEAEKECERLNWECGGDIIMPV